MEVGRQPRPEGRGGRTCNPRPREALGGAETPGMGGAETPGIGEWRDLAPSFSWRWTRG